MLEYVLSSNEYSYPVIAVIETSVVRPKAETTKSCTDETLSTHVSKGSNDSLIVIPGGFKPVSASAIAN